MYCWHMSAKNIKDDMVEGEVGFSGLLDSLILMTHNYWHFLLFEVMNH